MPDERELAQRAAETSSIWTSKEFWTVLVLFVAGFVARTLVSQEPFDRKKFLGELILTAIGAVALYAAGALQGMSDLQMLMFGALGSLGGLRAVEWVIKAAAQVKGKA
ncbi:hypothetical protein EUZ85_19350 [Hahella sp. KA22]|nr:MULTISPECIES: hypothetical protein [unclassified Hahella]AZZ92762.1 hypothetical protein ENC22_16770 [Hahella sp. KA22]MBU6954544.1 hypothetical protein [Hahella sp. HN01]QAY56136.1 hypothetical protein EUZ85_19350 [Hahella sp. KA22]